MAQISSTVGPDSYTTRTENPYSPMGGLGLSGTGNLAELLKAILQAKKQQADKARRALEPAVPMQVGYTDRGADPNEGLRQRTERAQLRDVQNKLYWDEQGPPTQLVPTGYGFMEQGRTDVLPWSMQPRKVEVLQDPTSQNRPIGEDLAEFDRLNTLQKLMQDLRNQSGSLAQQVRSGVQ